MLFLGLGVAVAFLVVAGLFLWLGRPSEFGPGVLPAAASGPATAEVLAGLPTAVTPTSSPASAAAATPTRRIVTAASIPAAGTPAAAPSSAGEPGATAVAPAPGSATPQPSPTRSTQGFDVATLQKRMLELVNADRRAQGLQPLAWDPAAAAAGQKHAEEMAGLGYMSHWDIDGHGPDYRYSQAGGLDYSQENVYRLVHRWEDGSGAPIDDWDAVLRDAQAALMASPGHRANILTPEHTQLGVGIAYQPDAGFVSIAQEFVNHYVAIEPLPRRARPGDRVVLRGKLLPGSRSPLVNIGYEPFPKPLSLDELNATGTYTPKAQPVDVPQVRVGDDGSFVAEYTIPGDASPGLYHVLVWVSIPSGQERVQAVASVIEVR